jgi:hypothetical protein
MDFLIQTNRAHGVNSIHFPSLNGPAEITLLRGEKGGSKSNSMAEIVPLRAGPRAPVPCRAAPALRQVAPLRNCLRRIADFKGGLTFCISVNNKGRY